MSPTTTSATKRRASRSPSERSAKRHAGSSPEEGEVDDSGSPSQTLSLLPTPTPSVPKAVNLPAKPKVAFPFKTKSGPTSSTRPTLAAFEPSNGPSTHRLPPKLSPSTIPPTYARGYESRASEEFDRRWSIDNRGYGDDRHYRPGNYSRQEDSYSSHRERDNYRGRDYDDRRRREDTYSRRSLSPVSPPPLPPSHSMPPPPEHRSFGGPPPQPKTPPPPPPPPDSHLMSKDAILPDEHKSVSIALKRPSMPYEAHSPPSHRVPHSIDDLLSRKKNDGMTMDVDRKQEDERRREANMKRDEDRKREDDKKRQEGWVRPDDRSRDEERKKLEGWKREDRKEAEAPKPRLMCKKDVVRRTADEEFKAYGRKFVGCGQQSDYDVTTKLGEGTFGEVHKAIQKKTHRVVALKRILMHNEKEGMPVTALREIKILKALNHPSIVDILDMFVVRSSAKDPLSVYMVFPYMDHDLAGLLENDRVKLVPSQIKLYMKQLLEGTEYMHRNHILHRDMKAANLLISNTGELRIADFGLARSYDTSVSRTMKDGQLKERRYTNCVVTRWYRPPELLLGARQYGGEVDIWGIGCVMGEMFTKRPILPGNSDLDQLEKIWQLCGTPNQLSWPNFDALPGCDGVKRFTLAHPRRVKQAYESHMIFAESLDLIDKLLTCNPRERITATQALDHEYFWTEPLPADPSSLPSYEASHEFDKRGQRHQHPPPVPQHPVHMPHYNLQNASRGHTGQDFHPHNAPGMIRNAHHNNNRHIPYPGLPHGPPPHGPPHHGPPGPSNFDPDYRTRPNQSRYQGGGGGRPPYPPYQYNHNNPPNRSRETNNWVPRQQPPPPPHLPQRPPALQGGPPSHSRDSRHNDSHDSRRPPSEGGEANLNYG
ncbi:hypothetical protein H0H87_009660 [Tephrocybe sp. NHM501043]|nr:hypothetical protein H0H87_009660 [Tephrocybe sp. NHM501043]